MSVHSLHHVTAVSAHIKENRSFYTETLGLRLVKKSVNQDDVSAYHLFYADAVGTPGTDMTFFDWPLIGGNSPGPGSVSLTSFRILETSIDYWMDRLTKAGAAPELGVDDEFRNRILFADPEGQRLELIDSTGVPGKSTPWTAHVPEEFAIRGIGGVDIDSLHIDQTHLVLTQILGYTQTREGVFEVEDDSHHARIRLTTSGNHRMGRLGAGGIHHVAFRVADDEELNAMKEKVEALGLRTSGYVDRFYFHSLYFREPGGVLFELATDGPGFSADEDMATLGEHLALPPFLEGRRAEIEAGLKPI